METEQPPPKWGAARGGRGTGALAAQPWACLCSFIARFSMTLSRVMSPKGSVEMRCHGLIDLCLWN